MFVHQWPSLSSHFHAEYDSAGKNLFEDENVCVALARILRSILEDPLLKGAHKWIVSSCNWPNIERASNDAGRTVRLSLESNEDSISTAINTYIHS
jgi:hypothetical protein